MESIINDVSSSILHLLLEKGSVGKVGERLWDQIILISETGSRGICKQDEEMKNRNRPDTQWMKKRFSARSPHILRLCIAEKVRYMC